jgi:hypothetical protein
MIIHVETYSAHFNRMSGVMLMPTGGKYVLGNNFHGCVFLGNFGKS